ncbi:HvfA family oxazolone/thioamide-modified RiPP metallophore [Agrilutibacter solisilvae]|uniref:EF-hand domain-containing protein n=1 Tax=Agrilutibacter solisilvae TaxID=2763317 RepID=A0A975AQU5_9GAMM|nr:hypothetical protein [Lysobacter solisilvae]QSX77284.1 hypothetical protein I8J32_010845 [Lysobacter solisilvae]
MSKQNKPLALAVGAALVGGLALSASAFAMTDLASGYMVAAAHAGEEGKCGEGKCGMDKMDTNKDGKISSAEFGAAHKGDTTKFAAHDGNSDGFISADEMKAHQEGKCGEGKCGDDKKADPKADKKVDKKADMEGKCGEGKCGGMA